MSFKLRHRIYMYSLGLFLVILSAILFNNAAEHGWFTQEQLTGMTFALELILYLTFVEAILDVINTMEVDRQSLSWKRAGVISYFVIGVPAIVRYGSPFPVQAAGVGLILGLTLGLPLIVKTEPMASYCDKFDEWYERRSKA